MPLENGDLMEEYNRLRFYLGIDLMDLEQAFMTTPRILQDAGELAAAADAVENLTKHALEVTRAETADRLRQSASASSGRELSEARINSLLPLHEEVREAVRAYDDAIRQAQICQALYKSLEVQSRLLTKAADMLISGFITPTSIHDARRAEINRVRRREGQLGRPTS